MDEFLSLEEVFFERHFEYGDDPETYQNNYEKSLDIYSRSNTECADYAEKISDGEVVDIPSVTLALQNLIFSHKYVEQFKKAIRR